MTDSDPIAPHSPDPHSPDPTSGSGHLSAPKSSAPNPSAPGSSAPNDTAPKGARRGRVLGVTALGAALVAVAALPPWVQGRIDDPVLGHRAAEAAGQAVAPAILAWALVALAAVVVAAVTGRVGRVVAGLLTLAAGLASAWSAFAVLRDPSAALARSVSGSVGRTGAAAVSEVGLTAWPWVALVGGVLTALGGVGIVAGARRWGAGNARYENPAQATPEDKARAASAGGSESAPGTGQAAPGARPTPAQADAEARATRRRAVQDWDALSRGDDPTD